MLNANDNNADLQPSRRWHGASIAAMASLVLAMSGCAEPVDNSAEPLPDLAAIASIQQGQDSAVEKANALDIGDRDYDSLYKRGRRLWPQCVACHALDEEHAGRAGPHLAGIVGRRAASVPGFAYSDALSSTSIVWSQSALDAWIANPYRFAPGTSMQFGGIRNAEDRLALLMYIESESREP